MSENIIEIPKDPTFDLPAGRFPATVTSIKIRTQFKKETPEKEVRVLFDVHNNGIKNRTPLAGSTYPWNLNKESDLRAFLETINGSDWFEQMAGQKFDLDQLIGLEVELDLYHMQKPPYKKPMVLIGAIRPRPVELKQAA